ncbi:hypothetical protein LBR_09830 [Levilactobacillus brevis]|uniref:hypothetical protein n=1 Tax=Levilactobacillus brevis TaxID=1580 RepID=UPI000A0FFE32|nr:hypothetical protein [Levilactobacillus brevis]MCT3566528.1 hypothetical protein [Levilactobacillus brevis]ORJ54213.1 hypothetical protein LBR_09830 [Levilactobacillus brevis]
MLTCNLIDEVLPLFEIDQTSLFKNNVNILSDIVLSQHSLQHLSKPIKINVVQTNERNYTTIIAGNGTKVLVNDNFTFGYNGSGPSWLSDAIKEVDSTADITPITQTYHDKNGIDINSNEKSYTLEMNIS